MPLLLYSKTTCPYSRRVKRFLQEHDVAFEAKEKDRDPRVVEELVGRTGRDRVPTLVFENGEVLADTDRDEVERFMRDRGMLPRDRGGAGREERGDSEAGLGRAA